MADFVTTHRLTHKASLKMIEAGVAKAEALGCKVSLAVADQSCRLRAGSSTNPIRHMHLRAAKPCIIGISSPPPPASTRHLPPAVCPCVTTR